MSEGSDGPRDIRIAEDQHQAYVELTEDESSPFHEINKKDMFVFAMGYGFDQGLRTPIDGTTRALFNIESMSTKELWNARAVAVYETEDHSVLQDRGEVFTIAREYANGGMEQLYKKYTGPEDTFSELSNEIIEYGLDRLDVKE